MIPRTFRCIVFAIAIVIGLGQSARGQSCAADLNFDLTVDGSDLALLLASWGPCPVGAACTGNLNGDAAVDAQDLTVLFAGWGSCPAPVRLVGTVIREDGLVVADAVVVTQVGGMAVTDPHGDFQLDVALPAGASSVTVTAVTHMSGMQYTGSVNVDDAYPGQTYYVNLLIVVPTDSECRVEYDWIPTFGPVMGLDGQIMAMGTFDDGSGPSLYVGGSFDTGNNVALNGIARWDGEQWSPLGAGVGGAGGSGTVRAMAVHDDGTGPALYVAGTFSAAGGVEALNIAKWDGESWSAVGRGVEGSAFALATYDDGTGAALYAGGSFTIAGNVHAKGIAKWNGEAWSALGSEEDGPSFVRALAVYDDGDGPALFVGGGFVSAGGVVAANIARWDGEDWSALGGGVDGMVYALATYDGGAGPALYVGGSFRTADGLPARNIARWDGSAWRTLFNGGNGIVSALVAHDDGSGPALFAGGFFTWIGGVSVNRVARWDGKMWMPLGAGVGSPVQALVVHDDGSGPGLFAPQNSTCGLMKYGAVKWDGAEWSYLGGSASLGTAVYDLCDFDDGTGRALYAGLELSWSLNCPVPNGVAKWDGHGWSGVGGGLASGRVYCLAVYDDGSGAALYAAGHFTAIGGVPAENIAKWDGASWSALGSGLAFGPIYDLAVFDDGSGPALYAAGRIRAAGEMPANNIARWDGTAWSALGSGLTGGWMGGEGWAIAVHDDGSGPALFVGGAFSSAGGSPARCIAKWDGSTWSAVGSGAVTASEFTMASVYALTVYDDGSGSALYAGGNTAFNTSGGRISNLLAKWDGNGWSDVGGGLSGWYVVELTVYDHGSGPVLYVGGGFTAAGDLSVNNIAAWDGKGWSALGSGVALAQVGRSVWTIKPYNDGGGTALFVGGDFTMPLPNGPNIAKWGCARP